MTTTVHLRSDATCTINIDGAQLHRHGDDVPTLRGDVGDVLLQHAATKNEPVRVVVYDVDRQFTLRVHNDRERIEVVHMQPYQPSESAAVHTTASLLAGSGDGYAVGGGIVIGRRPQSMTSPDGTIDNLLPVDDPTVSRSHLVLHWHHGVLYCTDLGSTSGTTVHRGGADMPATGSPVPLKDGDRLTLGESTSFTLRIT